METFSFRESRFTPGQVETCTGLSTAMQRNWRQAGHIPERKEGIALFTPGDLVTIRLMVVLRNVGVGPSISRSIAERAVPSVLWLAMADFPDTWAVSGEAGQADQFRQKLELAGDDHLRAMSGLSGPPFLYGIAKEKCVEFRTRIEDFEFDEGDEVETIIKLSAVARRVASTIDQPLTTVIMPS